MQSNTNINLNELKFKSLVYDNLSSLEFDINVTNISNMFANRIDLVNIPSINLNNITNMENTFLNCSNLSLESYDKITNMLPNASNLTNSYLINLGLDRANFTNAQLNILNIKGYIDAIPLITLTYYNIYYNTNDV